MRPNKLVVSSDSKNPFSGWDVVGGKPFGSIPTLTDATGVPEVEESLPDSPKPVSEPAATFFDKHGEKLKWLAIAVAVGGVLYAVSK